MDIHYQINFTNMHRLNTDKVYIAGKQINIEHFL